MCKSSHCKFTIGLCRKQKKTESSLSRLHVTLSSFSQLGNLTSNRVYTFAYRLAKLTQWPWTFATQNKNSLSTGSSASGNITTPTHDSERTSRVSEENIFSHFFMLNSASSSTPLLYNPKLTFLVFRSRVIRADHSWYSVATDDISSSARYRMASSVPHRCCLASTWERTSTNHGLRASQEWNKIQREGIYSADYMKILNTTRVRESELLLLLLFQLNYISSRPSCFSHSLVCSQAMLKLSSEL